MVSTQLAWWASTNRPKAIPIMVLTAKHLIEPDVDQLNGHVATIHSRGSIRATDPRA